MKNKVRSISIKSLTNLFFPFKFLYNWKNFGLKAGALFYAVFIAFVIALITSSILLNNYLHQNFIIEYIQSERLERNLQSAMVLYNEDPSKINYNKSETISLFDNSDDEVIIYKYTWGVFDLVKFSTSWNNTIHTKIALVGTDVKESKPVALFLTDQQRYLSVSGASMLKGDCYLPQLGIRRAYIEGKSFMGSELVIGKTFKSESRLPEIDLSRIQSEMRFIRSDFNNSDSVFPMGMLVNRNVVMHTFYETTHTYYSPNWINLANQSVEGNIRIVSLQGVTVERSVSLKEVIIYAPKVEIMDGFKGSVQVFATDTVIIGNECTFLSPTAIVLQSGFEKPYIEIGNENIIKGDIYLATTATGTQAVPEIQVNKDTRIEGQLYVNGKIDLKGTIWGSLYCNGFILRTPSALYENHLLDAIVDYTSLSKFYSGFMLLPPNAKTKKMKWVN